MKVSELDALINANGGEGEFESGSVERWPFPRYEGADEKDKKGNYKDPGAIYLSRPGIAHDTDVETLAAWLEAPRDVVGAILLEGEPGTGKTALTEAAVTLVGRPMTTVVCTPDHTKDSLMRKFVGEGKGDKFEVGGKEKRSPYTLGPLPYAAKHGHVLYLDEFRLLLDGVKPITYSLTDGRKFLPEGNVDGSALEIHPDFRVIYSSNPGVRGASLPEPIASRCAGTTLRVETSAALLRDLGIEDLLVEAWKNLKTEKLWAPQVREMRAAHYWLSVSPHQALAAMVPEHCPESQREAVAKVVAPYIINGTYSPDARLRIA